MDQSLIDRIREENNIIDVIGSYIPLKRYGSNFKARCPFHDEKTPSFVVSENKQIFRCFGCGASGNVITFVRDYEKISFFEALKRLADRAGITIQNQKKAKNQNSRRELVLTAYSLAVGHYKNNLFKYGETVLNYLHKRSITNATIEKFEIGYALDSFNALQNYLLKNQINGALLPHTGLFGKSKHGLFDSFRNRIMFPIHNATGRIVAFGGRVFEENFQGGKYINSPTTEIYTKGDQLYGLHKTRYEIAKKDSAIICEGYLDFLRLYETEFENSVASLGTALTPKQIQLLSRYTKNFIFLYDGDKAGRKAAIKASISVLEAGFNAKIVFFPENEDPDSFILQYGKQSLQQLLDRSQSLTEALYSDTLLNLKMEEKIRLLTETANNLRDLVKRELLVKEISETFHIQENAVKSKIKKVTNMHAKIKKTSYDIHPEERAFIWLLMQYPELFDEEAKEITKDHFSSEDFSNIFVFLKTYYIHNQNLDVSNILSSIPKELSPIFSEIVMEDELDINQSEVLQAMKTNLFLRQLKDIEKKITSSGNDISLSLLKQKKELKIKIAKYYKSVTWKLQ